MHVLFRDGFADRAYLDRYADDAAGLEAHLATRTPEWASAICGVPADDITALAHLLGRRPRAFFRIGYGFARSRNGAVAMHAVTSLPVVLGSWQYEGGGALHSNSGMFGWNKRLIEGLDLSDGKRAAARSIAHRRRADRRTDGVAGRTARHRPCSSRTPTPVSVAPDQEVVKRGFARPDLFTVVHEQIMTDTARMARRRAARYDVRRARRRLSGGRAEPHPARPEADRTAGRVPVEPRGRLRVGEAARGRALRPSA